MTDPWTTIDQDLWRETPRKVFRLDLTAERFARLKALWRSAIPFREICRINYGAQVSSKERGGFGRGEYLAPSSRGMADPKRFYEGSNMRPFGMTWDGVWLDWRPELFYGSRTTTLFENAKMSIRHISGAADSFVSWVDRDHYYTDHGVIHCVPYHAAREEQSYRVTDEQIATSECYSLFYLLGVVMSRPVLTYYAELFATGSLQGAFSHVYPETVKELPVPKLAAPLPDPPTNWVVSVDDVAGGGTVDRAVLRRLFPQREATAATLSAVAERRQELEAERGQRAQDFKDFMRVRAGDWNWPKGRSLDVPPPEGEFLEAVAGRLDTVGAVARVRDAFREKTAEAQAAVAEAAKLERAIDALAERVFALQA